jgi:opacity protein-like surface antigen
MRSTSKRVFFAAAIAFTLMLPSRTAAQSLAEPGTWTATPFIGFAFGVSNDLDSSLSIGGAIGYHLTANLGFEAEFGHVFDVVGDDANVDWSVTSFSVNGLYHFDVVAFTPYATFGIGFVRSSVNVAFPDPIAPFEPTSTEVSFNFGGGIKYRLAEGILARGDVRRFQANDAAPDYWRVYGGISFQFGR